MKEETVAKTLADLLPPSLANHQSNIKDDDIDFGSQFLFRPKSNSTPTNKLAPLTNLTNDSAFVDYENSALFSANSPDNVVSLLNKMNIRVQSAISANNASTSANSIDLRQQSTNISNRLSSCDSTPVKDPEVLKDESIIAAAREIAKCIPTNYSFRNGGCLFNFPVTSNNGQFSPQSAFRNSYNHYFPQNSNLKTLPVSNKTNLKSLINNFSPIVSPDLSPDNECPSFDKNWQDRKQQSIIYNAYNGNYLDSINRQVKQNRSAATHSLATCTWRGQLPHRLYRNPTYSTKVFLGGIPWDINEANLKSIFSKYGQVQVEWPGKQVKCSAGNTPEKCGYVYIVFASEESVRALLRDCIASCKNGSVKWYYNVPTKRMPIKVVQVVPWIRNDADWVKSQSQRLDPNKTVFVGALHGMVTADALARIMNDLFGNVVYVGIDTDQRKYPLGSARVSFSSYHSYIRAIKANFIDVKSNKFNKTIQIEPYLVSSNCSSCHILPGPYFCKSLTCFRYYCVDCYYWMHSREDYKNHYPIMRYKRDRQH